MISYCPYLVQIERQEEESSLLCPDSAGPAPGANPQLRSALCNSGSFGLPVVMHVFPGECGSSQNRPLPAMLLMMDFMMDFMMVSRN